MNPTNSSGPNSGRPRMRNNHSRRPPRRPMRPRLPNQPMAVTMPSTAPIAENLRIIPLGGVEEIGKNMTALEYKDEIVIVDIGFQFPDDNAPGVDYIIPDVSYLEARKSRIRGVFITHGHLDHIGGIPYVMPKIGNPPIFTRLLSSVMIKKRQDEFPHFPKLDLQIVEKDSRIKLGNYLSVRFFNVTHTIPDAMGVIVETPLGNIVFTGDLKIDHDNGVPTENEQVTFGALSSENNLVLLMDSTNVERPGFSFSERHVHENLAKIIADAPGRLIMGTFASLLERIIFVIMNAEATGKKIVIEGRSMRVNVEIAKELGMLKCKPTTIISAEEMENHPANKIIILATGAQGDEFAALSRMANKQSKSVKLNRTDTILLSSSVIPGNEKSVQKLKDNLARQGAKIIHYRVADVHSSGHAHADESAWIHKMIKPKWFIPIHGYHHMLRVHAEVAEKAGTPIDRVIIPDNGSIIEFSADGQKAMILKEKAGNSVVMIDGLGNGDVKEVVIRDRQVLAQDGIFVIIAIVDPRTGKVRSSPDIISRGFVYLKESQDLLRNSRALTKKTIEELTLNSRPINIDYVKNGVREKIGKFLLKETNKRPIILPVILEF